MIDIIVSYNINPCLISPYFFIINTAVAYTYDYTFYSFLWFQLMLTSFYYHGVGDIISTILDKATICTIVPYGGYIFATKIYYISDVREAMLSTVVVCSFLGTIYLYVYGKHCGRYCFNKNPLIGNWWHACLHVISVLGHLCIILI